jgi:hypothetical protein
MGWGSDIIKKRLLTLFLDVLKLRNFLGLVKNEATVDAHGYDNYHRCVMPFFGMTQVALYISAWASALLVQLNRAMRRPQDVGRVTEQTLTLFFYAFHLK